MKDVSNTSVAELLQFLANARKTEAQALGHTKTAMNAQMVRLYKEELQRREVRIPTDDELYEVGSFNGVGSV